MSEETFEPGDESHKVLLRIGEELVAIREAFTSLALWGALSIVVAYLVGFLCGRLV